MNPFNLIFLRSDKVLLSKKIYSSWKEIQDEFEDYMTSINFESLEDIEEYIKMEYKLSREKSRAEVGRIRKTDSNFIELEFENKRK